MSIRKFKRDALAGQDLLRTKSLTRPMLDLLTAVVGSRLNILISGGTGAGKTTMLNILSSFIPSTERIVTIEDSAGASAAPAARGAAGDAVRQHRGAGRDPAADAAHQRAAHAAGPHRGGRGARREAIDMLQP
jgi:pilus assembly protein CpaF